VGLQTSLPEHSQRTAPKNAGDRAFPLVVKATAVLIVITLTAVAFFLIRESIPALTTDASEIPLLRGRTLGEYTLTLIGGTVLAATIALIIATPVAIGIALYISHYAPPAVARRLGVWVDLLAAIPSVIYGLWAIFVFAPALVLIHQWLEDTLGFLPFFAGPASVTGRTMLTTGMVLAVMILPIITAISREVFFQTPRMLEEASLALGATRWEMIRTAVLPHARSGIVSAAMLAMGRALGETMAVALVLSGGGVFSLNLISANNPSTIASNIALTFPEASGISNNLLFFTGLVLFVMTFAVNFLARAIVARAARKG
jgi:phosphate transport system permease protein